MADDNNTYTFSVQATDQSNGKTVAGNPIHEPGISCKLWLTKSRTDVSANMSPDQLKAVDNLSQPFPKEEVNALDFFDPSTPQTQMCNAKGQANWNYKVTTSVEHGSYFLVVLTDWSGVHWSWSGSQSTLRSEAGNLSYNPAHQGRENGTYCICGS